MNQNLYMNQFFRSINSDLIILDKQPSAKNLCKVLSETVDSTRCQWAIIQSKIKSNIPGPKVIPDLLKLNDIVNNGLDAGYELLLRDSNDILIDYFDAEIFLSYSFFLDALHDMEIYYTISINFPYQNLLEFAKRKAKINTKLNS